MDKGSTMEVGSGRPSGGLKNARPGAQPRTLGQPRIAGQRVGMIGARSSVAFWAAILFFSACDQRDVSLPTQEQVQNAYQYNGDLSAEMSGNVAVVTVSQPYSQVRRGGNIWTKTGPYIVLFTQQTQGLFQEYGGLAAVRVITQTDSGQEIARATLARADINELTWKRALNIAGHARLEGTRKPTRLEDLIEWGEDHTDFEYNPRYILGR